MTVTLHRLRRSVLLVLAASALFALGGAPAQAADSTRLLRDCQDGTISGSYTQADYAQALRDIPTDVDEYTDCRSVIRRAQLGSTRSSDGGGGSAAGGTGGGGAPGGSGSGSGSGGGATGATGGGGTGAATGVDASTANGVLATATPRERAAVAAAAGGAGGPVRVGSGLVRPAQLASGVDLPHAGLPGALVASLIGLGLATLLAVAWWAWSLVDARRTATP